MQLIGAGVKSGKNVDKFAEMNLTKEECNFVKCPAIKESPVSIECKVKEIKELGSHHMFIAEVLAINADKKYITNVIKESKKQIQEGKYKVIVSVDDIDETRKIAAL